MMRMVVITRERCSGGVTTCLSTLFFSSVSCDPNPCDSFTVVHSNFADINITGNTGDVVHVVCDPGYSGEWSISCEADGMFSSSGMSCVPEPCTSSSIANSDHSDTGSITGFTGDEISVTCDDGFVRLPNQQLF